MNDTSLLRKLTNAILFVTLINPLWVYGASNSNESPRFDIHASPALAQYLDLLEYPPYLELALENSGVSITASGKLLILDEHTAKLKNVTLGDVNFDPSLRFLHREGAIFSYEASMINVSIPVNIDTTDLSNGTISIIFPQAAGNIVLTKFSQAIRDKIQTLASDSLQQRMLKYFYSITANKPDGRNLKEWITSQIIIAGYNRRAFEESEIRNDETPSFWWFLILIPIILVVFLAIRKLFFKKRLG
jgi:hypothetical protein